ncbi:hypothetical protein PR048_033775 [Dryococelus australis]|uniref:Uncharacterized protein n=1 Tax=Dryococelus australis TaxID=614101 RepID=A0ABQ9FZ06_9NEOP|nr:hypothetical protein PR048_033775 [Dryococelus australis]
MEGHIDKTKSFWAVYGHFLSRLRALDVRSVTSLHVREWGFVLGGKLRGQSKSRSSRAGLQFPSSGESTGCAQGNYAERVGEVARLYLVCDGNYWQLKSGKLAGNAARE